MTFKVTYPGDLCTLGEYPRLGATFTTDAPVDNNGLGKRFSPTATVATGLASCVLTTMGIKASGLDVNLSNATAEVNKHMAAEPRRIPKIAIDLRHPKAISDKNQKILEHTASTCHVHFSLHPEIEKAITFNWVL